MQGTGQSCPPDTASRPAGTTCEPHGDRIELAAAGRPAASGVGREQLAAANRSRRSSGLALPGGLVTQGADHAPGFVGPPLVVHGGSLVSRVRSGFTVRFRD